jgi:glycosyltransferase involved in cell wall biosynthesis
VLSDIDVLVVPSIWYDFPLVIPSAFATRTPVVATDLPGMNEWVRPDSGGLLFERGNWRDLAARIRQLLETPALLASLRARLPPVKSMRDFTAECAASYAELAVRAERARSPKH